MNNPKVSIIIPVYNGSKYLREAIDSAIGQTYPNVEVIVVNDGSDDSEATQNIALSYGEKIRYFLKDNGGVSTALNLGISQMTGEYFSWLSHDDVYHPNKIQAQINYLKGNQLEKDTILYGNYELIDESSKKINEVRFDLAYPENKLNISLFPVLKGLVNGCCLLIHKSHFEKCGLFDRNLLLASDYDLWFKMFRNAKVRFVPGVYVKNRIHHERSSLTRGKRYLEECNALWISLINGVTTKEMSDMDGSPYLFYNNTAQFLKESTVYREAIQYAESLVKETKGKISVIIPFYNRIPHLLDAINSVLSQSYSKFELLLVDDGSTEDISLVKTIKDPRITLIQQEHKGVSAARNLGISKATGEYIAFLDSDDVFLPNKLEKQITFMEKNNLSFSHTSYLRMYWDGRPNQIVHSGRFCGKVFPRIMANCGVATPTVMVKKEVLSKIFFDETIEIAEDTCLWIDIAYHYTLGGIDELLTNVRIGKTASAFSVEKQRIGCLSVANHVIKNPLYAKHTNEIYLLLTDLTDLFKPSDNTPDQPIEKTSNPNDQPSKLQSLISKYRK